MESADSAVILVHDGREWSRHVLVNSASAAFGEYAKRVIGGV